MVDLSFNRLEGNTIEKEAIMKIVRESIKESLSDIDAETLQFVDKHVSNMKELVDSPAYEILCISPLIGNIKHMSLLQRQRYLTALENFARAYASLYGNRKLLLLTLAGLIHTAHTEEEVAKYGSELYKIVQEKRDKIAERAKKESEAFSALSEKLVTLDRGLFKFLNYRQIRQIKLELKKRRPRLRMLEKALQTYDKKARLVGSLLKGK